MLCIMIVYWYMKEYTKGTYKERREQLRAQVIEEMEEMRREGLTFEAIGKLYGLSRAGVNNFMKGHTLVNR